MEFKPARERRYKVFAVTPELVLQSIFNPGVEGENVTVQGIPEGAEFTDVIYDFEMRAFLFRIWHQSFDIVPDCERIPQIQPVISVERMKPKMREFL